MRRKLIKQDAFDRITNESVTAAESELIAAESILAKALDKDHLSLRCFNESTVVYETLDNTYVHAGYEIKNDQITFNNIEELVIDESTRKDKMRGILSNMIDSVLEENNTKADSLFKDYLGMVNWNEAKFVFGKKGDDDKGGFPAKKFGKKDKSKNHDKSDKEAFVKKADGAGKDVKEAYITTQNVLDYIEYTKVGPALAESVAKADDHGNVTDLRVPASRARNEGHILSFNWKTLNHKVKVLRDGASGLTENQDFCKAMAQLKRQNAFSDEQGLENVLENVVKTWPQILYVTQSELARIIGEALDTAGVKNYGDETCEFMAEGILRKAHGAYSEKVQQILHLASAPKVEANADPYLHFQSVVEQFYPAVDEKFGLERKAFADLYSALETIWHKADRRGDKGTKNEAASYLNELAAVLNGEVKPDLKVAEESANWLAHVIETNLSMGTWNVSNTAHNTVNGDHPDMAKKAAHGYSPSKDFSGDWGDSAPMISQDSMSYKGGAAKQARSNSWGNVGGSDTYPSLKNPYVPKPFGDYTMKGEKGVDKDTFGQHHSTWQSGDTWPALTNPYVPKEAGGTGGKGYKMKNGSGTDLVVDR